MDVIPCTLTPSTHIPHLEPINAFISSLTDLQLATLAEEIYNCHTEDSWELIVNWLNENTKLPGYHTIYMVQNWVTKEVLRRYINTVYC